MQSKLSDDPLSTNGWIKLHRSLLNHPRFKDPGWLSVFVYLNLNATFSTVPAVFRGRVINLRPGQLITGRFVMAKACQLSPGKIVRTLKQLVVEGEIDLETSTKSSLITLLNWEAEQGKNTDLHNRKTAKIDQQKNVKTGRQSMAANGPREQIDQQSINGRSQYKKDKKEKTKTKDRRFFKSPFPFSVAEVAAYGKGNGYDNDLLLRFIRYNNLNNWQVESWRAALRGFFDVGEVGQVPNGWYPEIVVPEKLWLATRLAFEAWSGKSFGEVPAGWETIVVVPDCIPD